METITMALFSPPISSPSLQNSNFIPKFSFSLLSSKRFSLLSVTRAYSSSSSDSGITSPAVTEPVAVIVKEAPSSTPAVKKEETAAAGNVAVEGEEMKTTETLIKFEDARWRYHLPEAELLNGRAAMIGFFMAYFVDSLTGVGLVDQMGNFFCKTLLFVAVAGVLFIRKNEDVDKLKKLFDETTLYDKQWQAAWKDGEDSSSELGSKK
ncbi:unnamed protein product [Thlaspi arvense]|uniref:Uncharacterized protein n=1 Tax=Thlaspi arvense TaxID=13288 RepID=A0AAU9T418_THLAR|nr:unnamed protein product [Thlaspi arvense]